MTSRLFEGGAAGKHLLEVDLRVDERPLRLVLRTSNRAWATVLALPDQVGFHQYRPVLVEVVADLGSDTGPPYGRRA